MMSSRFVRRRYALPAILLMAAALLGGGVQGALGVCGPFADVADEAFCPFVLELFRLGITTGTTPTTYAPGDPVTRLQAAALLSRSVDVVLRRASRRTTVGQVAFPGSEAGIALTTVGVSPIDVRFDGADLWVSSADEGSVSRVRASDGRLLETWTGMVSVKPILIAMGRVFVGRANDPGFLYRIDPSQPAGVPELIATNLGTNPRGLAFDGARIWAANDGIGGGGSSISIITPGNALPWTVTTVPTDAGYVMKVLYDGADIWVTNTTSPNNGHLLRLNAAGSVVQNVAVGRNPDGLMSDGTNLWVANYGSNSVSVVRASTGTLLATLTGNGLLGPSSAAFDGERVVVTNVFGNSVSLWKAADLTPLGTHSFGAGTAPNDACSDGVFFWVTLWFKNKLARF